MNPKELEEVSDSEILNKLESVEMTFQVLESENWAWFREAWRRIYEEADRRLDLLDPTDVSAVMRAQYAKRFYRNVLETTIKQLKDYSDITYAEAKERGLFNRFVERIRAKLGFLASRKS